MHSMTSVIVFRDDILIYSKIKVEHKKHLKTILTTLKLNKSYSKFFKCIFLLHQVAFFGHVVSIGGV